MFMAGGAGVQERLREFGLYQRLKASRLYDMYWGLADRMVIVGRDAEVAFYRRLLGGLQPGDLIYDIGANHGYKTDIFLRLGARVVAVDPDPVNQRILRQRFLTYRMRRKQVVVVGKAVSDQSATQTLWVDEPGSAKNTLSTKWVATLRESEQRFGSALTFAQQQQVQTVTMAHLVRDFGRPFFVKIDVEGHEPNVLQGMSEPVPYLSFEINLPEFLDEGLRCVRLVDRLASGVEFNYAGPNLGDGLVHPAWVGFEQFSEVLRSCRERSIEVFCRTPVPTAHGRTGGQ